MARLPALLALGALLGSAIAAPRPTSAAEPAPPVPVPAPSAAPAKPAPAPPAPVKTGPKVPGRTAWSKPPATAVAIVNGEPITVAQWAQRMSVIFGTQALDSLVQETIVRQEARRQGIRIPPAEVTTKVEEEIKGLPTRFGGPERFKEFMKQRNMTEPGLREAMRPSVEMRLITDKLRDKVTASIKITDEEIAQAYESQKFMYQVPEEARINHILVAVTSTDEKADAAAKAKAQQILERVKGKTVPQFADVAKEASEDLDSKAKGGEIPPLHKPSFFGPSFDNAVFAASPGVLPEPVRSFRGWHVVYLQERQPARTRPMEEVKSQLREGLLSRKKNEQFATYMNNVLKGARQEVRLQY